MSLNTMLRKLTNRRGAIASLAAASASAAVLRPPKAKAAITPLSSESFRYVTMFNYKSDTPDHIRKEYEHRWIEFMIACPEAQMPELNTPLAGQVYKPGQSFQYFSTIVFANTADCEVYLHHPLHMSLHHEVVLPYADMPGVFGGRYAYRPARDNWFGKA